jgi:hypothetical protein
MFATVGTSSIIFFVLLQQQHDFSRRKQLDYIRPEWRQFHENMEQRDKRIGLSYAKTFLLSKTSTAAGMATQLTFVVVCGGHSLPMSCWCGRLLFFAIAVGKTDGQAAVFGADILSLKPIASPRISGGREVVLDPMPVHY